MKKNKPCFTWDPENYKNKAFLEYDWRKRKTNSLIFNEGVPLPEPDVGRIEYSQDPSTYDLIFDSEVPEDYLLKWDILPNTASSPLINQRALDILLDLCPDDFQYFPTLIRNKDDSVPVFENRDYFLINICVIVDAVDYDLWAPEYDEDGDFDDLNGAILSAEGMGSHHIARLKGFRMAEIVSAELVRRFKKEKIKGIKFTEKY